MKTFLFFLISITLLMPTLASADLGPKPTMTFNFVYKTQTVPTIINGEQIECPDSLCSTSAPLEGVGPQHFECSPEKNQCSSLAYGYNDFHKLSIIFSDKTRESQIFKEKSFNAVLKVIVYDDKLEVTETTGFSGTRSGKLLLQFFPNALLTMIIELLVALLFFRKSFSKKIFQSVLLANLISLPVFWFIMFLGNLSPLIESLTNVFVLEVLIVIFEAWFIYRYINKIISFKESLLLGLLMNISSYFVGEMIIMVFVFVLRVYF
jgi:hypothetical protein